MYCMNIIRLQSTFLDGKLVRYHFIEKRFLNTTFKIMNIILSLSLREYHIW